MRGRLKRVFNIDKVNGCAASREGALGYIEICSECGGDVRIIPKALAPLAGQALASIA